jgi:hypothetical protein
MATTKKGPQRRLNAGESLFGFVSWLTTRPNKITLSSKNTPNPVLELLKKYIFVNGLPPCRPDYADLLVTPQGLDHVTDEEPTNSVMKPVTPEEVAEKVKGLIGCLPYDQQNAVIAQVIRTMRYQRQGHHDNLQTTRMRLEQDERQAYTTMQDLENAIRGDFTVFTKTVTQQ